MQLAEAPPPLPHPHLHYELILAELSSQRYTLFANSSRVAQLAELHLFSGPIDLLLRSTARRDASGISTRCFFVAQILEVYYMAQRDEHCYCVGIAILRTMDDWAKLPAGQSKR